jgi:amino acid permease
MPGLTDYRFVLRVKSEYWLSFLKVVAIVLFIIGGVLANVGVSREHRFIGWSNWHIHGAPFVGGFGKSSISGFGVLEIAHMLILVSDGGMESLGITAGETRNPSRNMPRVVQYVFWLCVCRCLELARTKPSSR